MKRRTTLGLLAVLSAGLVAGATALAFGHGGRHGMMKRVVAAAVDEALDEAKVTPEQRATVHAARDRVFAVFEEHRASHRGRLEEALALFEDDRVDPARLDALRQQSEEDHRRMREAVTQALLEIHDTLTPDQRRAVAGWVRAHRPGHLN
jgi:Spy/CpxP family protein refolding chaperone